jgi:ABC-type Fe3+/spermidine/putrescine transport system ATPase subunit
MSDRVAVMNQGHILQYGSPTEVYERPSTRFVSEFLGTSNLFRGEIAGQAGGYAQVAIKLNGAGPLMLRAPTDKSATGASTLLAVRPEKMRLTESARADGDGVAAEVVDHVFRGTYHAYQVRVAGRAEPLFVYHQADGSGGAPFERGRAVHVCWRPEHVVVLAEDAP